jgi:hypothetical protein
VACRECEDLLASVFSPKQVGFGVAGGAEAAIHAVTKSVAPNSPHKILVKLDFSNAFNSLHRDFLLEEVSRTAPDLLPLTWQAYRHPSLLFYGDNIIHSERGVQQGDPLGPALFCIALNSAVQTLESSLNIWYLDDSVIAGEIDSV